VIWLSFAFASAGHAGMEWFVEHKNQEIFRALLRLRRNGTTDDSDGHRWGHQRAEIEAAEGNLSERRGSNGFVEAPLSRKHSEAEITRLDISRY
jgi:hypothetical protein